VRPNPIFRFTLSLLFVISALAPTLRAAPQTGVTVSIDPRSLALPIGGTRQFGAKVIGTTNTAVTWTVNNLAAGDATVGTISGAGFYTAPAVPPPGYVVTVKATSVADPTAFAACNVTVRNPIPNVASVTPSPLPLGPFTLTVKGSLFMSGAQVLWNSAPLPTNYVSATLLTATGSATQTGSFNVTVANPGPGAVSAAFVVKVVSSVVVVVTPSSAGLMPGAAQQFR